jgi:hypothetical protein
MLEPGTRRATGCIQLSGGIYRSISSCSVFGENFPVGTWHKPDLLRLRASFLLQLTTALPWLGTTREGTKVYGLSHVLRIEFSSLPDSPGRYCPYACSAVSGAVPHLLSPNAHGCLLRASPVAGPPAQAAHSGKSLADRCEWASRAAPGKPRPPGAGGSWLFRGLATDRRFRGES